MTFCYTETTCIVEAGAFLIPYYIFTFFACPLRYYEVSLSAQCAMPGRVPRVHIAKRLLTLLLTALSLALAVLYVVVWHFGNGGVLGVGDDLVILYSCLVHFIAYAMSFALLKKEYERYLPQTWIGLRGLWFCAGVEGVARFGWYLSLSDFRFLQLYDAARPLARIGVGKGAPKSPSFDPAERSAAGGAKILYPPLYYQEVASMHFVFEVASLVFGCLEVSLFCLSWWAHDLPLESLLPLTQNLLPVDDEFLVKARMMRRDMWLAAGAGGERDPVNSGSLKSWDRHSEYGYLSRNPSATTSPARAWAGGVGGGFQFDFATISNREQVRSVRDHVVDDQRGVRLQSVTKHEGAPDSYVLRVEISSPETTARASVSGQLFPPDDGATLLARKAAGTTNRSSKSTQRSWGECRQLREGLKLEFGSHPTLSCRIPYLAVSAKEYGSADCVALEEWLRLVLLHFCVPGEGLGASSSTQLLSEGTAHTLSPLVLDFVDVDASLFSRPEDVGQEESGLFPPEDGSVSVALEAAGVGAQPPSTPAGGLWLARVDKNQHQAAGFDVSVPRFEVVQDGGFVAYCVQTIVTPPQQVHRVLRRYREFADLHSRLRREVIFSRGPGDLHSPLSQTASPRLPPLPAKMRSVLRKDYAFLQRRRTDLEQWLHSVVGQPFFRALPAVREFLFSTDPEATVVPQSGSPLIGGEVGRPGGRLQGLGSREVGGSQAGILCMEEQSAERLVVGTASTTKPIVRRGRSLDPGGGGQNFTPTTSKEELASVPSRFGEVDSSSDSASSVGGRSEKERHYINNTEMHRRHFGPRGKRMRKRSSSPVSVIVSEPMPTLHARIQGWEMRAEQGLRGQEFCAYCVVVTRTTCTAGPPTSVNNAPNTSSVPSAPVEWTAWRRFRDFAHLLAQLKVHAGAEICELLLPPLPDRYHFLADPSPEIRAPQLGRFLQELVSAENWPHFGGCAALQTFLGPAAILPLGTTTRPSVAS